jgi:uncharacterized protein
MNNVSREFQVFVKPVSSECNLNCRYCYYLEKGHLFQSTGFKRMAYDILERYIVMHIESTTEMNIFFSWHGGEPTLAGLDFFRKVVDIQKKHLPADRKILNGIQTNATLLDDDFCRFLSDEGFIAGVSFDGPEKFHDKFRISGNKSVSFKKAMNGYELLKKHNVPAEILTVVNSENVIYPMEVYRFIRSLGSEYLTFLPLVQRDSNTPSGASIISVSPVAFGTFMTAVFDEWVSADIGKIKIQIIEEAVRTAFHQEHTLCIFKETCGGVPVIEHNGDFYSCDHFVDEKHLVGNINNRSLSDMLDSQEQKSFGGAKLKTLPQYCKECEVRNMCNGECPKNRFITTPYGEPGLNYLCKGYKTFFNHIRPFADAVAEEWRRQNNS